MAIRLLMFYIGAGVGIGIEPCCVLRRVFMNGIASLSEFRKHHDDAVEQLLSIPIPIATDDFASANPMLRVTAPQQWRALDQFPPKLFQAVR